jgi:hypothetical protein
MSNTSVIQSVQLKKNGARAALIQNTLVPKLTGVVPGMSYLSMGNQMLWPSPGASVLFSG